MWQRSRAYVALLEDLKGNLKEQVIQLCMVHDIHVMLGNVSSTQCTEAVK